MSYFFLYLAAINVITFAAMGIDKAKARAGKWRIAEGTLLPSPRSAGRSAARWACACSTTRRNTRNFASAFPRCCACSAQPWCISF